MANHSDTLERIPCAQPHQWLYLFGSEGGIVYSEVHNRFAGLDAAGVAAYLALDAGMSLEQAPEIAHAQHHVIELIHALAKGIFPPVEPRRPWPELNPNTERGESREVLFVGDVPVSVQFPAGPFEHLCRAPFRGCRPAPGPPRCHLSASRSSRGWSIFVNGQPWMALEREEQLGLGFLHAARAMLYELGSYDVAFHAAMIAQGNRGILLSAPRESGKSTLTAYLSATGFDYLADEPALLQLGSSRIHLLPLPLSLKAGSWTPLTPACPKLVDELIHTRSDGMAIRLLLPQEEHISRYSRPLTHIVFPKYTPSAEAQLEPLSPLHAICSLDDGGMLFAQGRTKEHFEAFLHTICHVPAYRLKFSSLEEAARLLHQLS